LKNKAKSLLKYLVFVAISGGFLYLALRNTDFKKLAYDFANAQYGYVIASMVMGYLAFISRGIRWNILLEPLGKKANTWNAIHAIAIGYFANTAVPRAGELARCTALSTSDNIPLNRLFGTVVLERVIDGLILLSLMLITVITQFDNFMSFFAEAIAPKDSSHAGNSQAWIWKAALAVLLVGGLLVLFLLRDKFKSLPIYAKIREFWNGFKEGFKSLNKVKNKTAFIGHTLFIWLMYYLMIYVVFFALPATQDINPATGLLIMVVGGLGMVIPAPGGIGSYHYLVMLGLGVLGVAAADGVSFATLVHSAQFVMTIIAGLVGLIYLYVQKQKQKNKTSHEA
jgi:uncharacterized membrane protein YbhN (UPF0104 family)